MAEDLHDIMEKHAARWGRRIMEMVKGSPVKQRRVAKQVAKKWGTKPDLGDSPLGEVQKILDKTTAGITPTSSMYSAAFPYARQGVKRAKKKAVRRFAKKKAIKKKFSKKKFAKKFSKKKVFKNKARRKFIGGRSMFGYAPGVELTKADLGKLRLLDALSKNKKIAPEVRSAFAREVSELRSDLRRVIPDLKSLRGTKHEGGLRQLEKVKDILSRKAPVPEGIQDRYIKQYGLTSVTPKADVDMLGVLPGITPTVAAKTLVGAKGMSRGQLEQMVRSGGKMSVEDVGLLARSLRGGKPLTHSKRVLSALLDPERRVSQTLLAGAKRGRPQAFGDMIPKRVPKNMFFRGAPTLDAVTGRVIRGAGKPFFVSGEPISAGYASNFGRKGLVGVFREGSSGLKNPLTFTEHLATVDKERIAKYLRAQTKESKRKYMFRRGRKPGSKRYEAVVRPEHVGKEGLKPEALYEVSTKNKRMMPTPRDVKVRKVTLPERHSGYDEWVKPM